MLEAALFPEGLFDFFLTFVLYILCWIRIQISFRNQNRI